MPLIWGAAVGGGCLESNFCHPHFPTLGAQPHAIPTPHPGFVTLPGWECAGCTPPPLGLLFTSSHLHPASILPRASVSIFATVDNEPWCWELLIFHVARLTNFTRFRSNPIRADTSALARPALLLQRRIHARAITQIRLTHLTWRRYLYHELRRASTSANSHVPSPAASHHTIAPP